MTRAYDYVHVVGFEDTNLLGNVYYVNHLSWQGRCREMFLREHAPDLLEEIEGGLLLVTVKCACEYLEELRAFDEVIVRMSLKEHVQNRLTLSFEYWRRSAGTEQLVARGEQQLVVMRREGTRHVATAIPVALRDALLPYSNAG